MLTLQHCMLLAAYPAALEHVWQLAVVRVELDRDEQVTQDPRTIALKLNPLRQGAHANLFHVNPLLQTHPVELAIPLEFETIQQEVHKPLIRTWFC